jgi:hypothetical protein
MSVAVLWMLVVTMLSPTGQVIDIEVGLFFSRPGCEYAANAIAAQAAVQEGYVPLGFSCTSTRSM